MASNSVMLATGGGSGNAYTLSISWSENSTNTNNNTSNITATATLAKYYNSFSVTNAGVLRVYWWDSHNGTRLVAESVIEEIGYTVNSRSVTGTFNATHNDDGTLSGHAWAEWELTNNYHGYPPASGSVDTPNTTLTTIARQVNISSVTGSFTDENLSPTVSWVNNGNRVDFKIELPSLGIDPWKRVNEVQGWSSYSPQFSQADIEQLYSLMPNTNTLTMRFTIVTVINGVDKFFSFIDKTFTIVNGNPVFTDYTFADTNSTTTAITGNNQVLISGKSTLAVTISAANKAVAQKQATMNNYTFQIAGLSANENYTTSAITKTIGSPAVDPSETPSATRDLVVTALDSRSQTTAVTKPITIVPYSNPTVAATAQRTNGFENTTTISITGTFSRIEVGGVAKNTVNTSSGVKYRYRQQGSSTWGSWINRTATVDTSTGKVTVANFTINLDNQAAFEFEVQITDKLATATASLTVSVGQPSFFIGADGRVSVGGMPTQSKKTGEAGLLQVFGRIFADNLYPVGSIYMTTTMTSASQVNAALGGTWVAWGAGRVPVGMGSNGTTNYTTVEDTGGEDTHKLTVDEMPVHKHTIAGFPNGNPASWADPNVRIVYQTTSDNPYPNVNAKINNAGGDQAHENRQPYITCYMYKRTA